MIFYEGPSLIMVISNLFFVSVLLICTYETQKALAEIEVTINTSPEKVNIGEKAAGNLIAKNIGNETIEIMSIEIDSPWDDISLLRDPVTLNSGRIYKTFSEITVPENAKPGVYEMLILLKTNESDYSTTSTINVDALQGVSLSGEIPFVIIAIITPGILTYFIIVYVLTRKFDRGYVEIGLVSIGFGFLAWGTLILMSNRSLYSILQTAHSIEDYFYAFLIAGAVGVGVVASVVLARKMYDFTNKNKKIAKFNKQLLLKGYAVDDEPTFMAFMTKNLKLAGTFGTSYSLKLKIYLKADTTNCAIDTVEGLARSYEEKPPHHLNLRPKYRSNCTFAKLKNILLDYDPSPLAKYIKDNENFREKVRKKYKFRRYLNKKLIFDHIANKIRRAKSLEDLEKVLTQYEFGGYAWHVLKILENEGTRAEKVYGEFSFINFSQISKIDLICYDHPFSLVVSLGPDTKEIPSTVYYSPGVLPLSK
jgi:hypothetical protein